MVWTPRKGRGKLTSQHQMRCHVAMDCQELCIPESCLFHVLSEYPGVEREAETQEEEQWLLAVLQSG